MNEGHLDAFSVGNPTAADAPTAGQTALLRHFDLLPAEGITRAEASALIDQLEAAPDWQEHLQAWHRDKFQLHPDLFAATPEPPLAAPSEPPVTPPPPAAPPQRSFREARWWQSQITDGSLYGYSFRQPSVNQMLVILESLDHQTPGWDRESKKRRAHRFMNELATLSPELCKPGCSFPHELPAEGDDSEEKPAFDPIVRAVSAPFVPNPYAATSAPPVAPSRPAWQEPVQPPVQNADRPGVPTRARAGGAGKWALLLFCLAAGAGAYGYFGFRAPGPVRDEAPASTIIADRPGGPAKQSANILPTMPAKDSQRRAMEKYPDLGKAGTPLNQTFVALVHQLEVERSPRLQQPDWPEHLADECAAALVIAPVGPKGTPAPISASSSPKKTTAATPAPTVPKTDSTPMVQKASATTPGVPPASAASPTATPRLAPGSIFVTLDAVNKASVNNFHYNWYSYYGDYDISFRQSVGIDVKVRNMMRASIPVTLRWAFFARRTQGNGRYVFAASEKRLELAPGQTISEALDSPMIQSTATVYYDYGMHYLSGSKYEGWLVQVVPEGSDQIIKQVGSTSYIEDYGKRSDFASILKQGMTKGGGTQER